jgi:GntR family transcriptional regulator/MocR family aminotransferase
MRSLYNLRRQALISAFEQYFGDRVTILGAKAGMHVMVRIATHLSDELVIQKAAAEGIGLISARKYYLQPQRQGEFIFGYGQLNEELIEQGIFRLSQILKD